MLSSNILCYSVVDSGVWSRRRHDHPVLPVKRKKDGHICTERRPEGPTVLFTKTLFNSEVFTI